MRSWLSAAWVGTAPAVRLAHFVARNQAAPAPTTAESSAVVAHAVRLGRPDDASIFEDARYRAAHQAVQLDADDRPGTWGWRIGRRGSHEEGRHACNPSTEMRVKTVAAILIRV
jgi:IS5 family transposase